MTSRQHIPSFEIPQDFQGDVFRVQPHLTDLASRAVQLNEHYAHEHEALGFPSQHEHGKQLSDRVGDILDETALFPTQYDRYDAVIAIIMGSYSDEARRAILESLVTKKVFDKLNPEREREYPSDALTGLAHDTTKKAMRLRTLSDTLVRLPVDSEQITLPPGMIIGGIVRSTYKLSPNFLVSRLADPGEEDAEDYEEAWQYPRTGEVRLEAQISELSDDSTVKSVYKALFNPADKIKRIDINVEFINPETLKPNVTDALESDPFIR